MPGKRKREERKQPSIFHHNLQNYSGHRGAINRGYNYIQASFDRQFIVAGFTEVRSLGAAEDVYGLAHALDQELTRLVIVNVGTSAVGRQSEYIGMAWNPGSVDVDYAGVVMPGAAGGHDWQVWNQAVRGLNDRDNMAEIETIADFRGLAYIAGTYNGRRFLFGFMHNMYINRDNTYLAFANLPTMANRALNTIGGDYREAEIIIGGDFNTIPHVTGNDRTIRLNPRYASDRDGPTNTTRSHTYDFFLVSNPAVLENTVHVYLPTRRGESEHHAGSDHAAISLDYVVRNRAPGT